MSIQVHIERLILDGLPLARDQGAGVQAAIEMELSRLLRTGAGEISPELRAGGAMPSVRAAALSLADTNCPRQIGHGIARTLANTLAAETSQPSTRHSGFHSITPNSYK